jgi:hypothetical protein
VHRSELVGTRLELGLRSWMMVDDG